MAESKSAALPLGYAPIRESRLKAGGKRADNRSPACAPQWRARRNSAWRRGSSRRRRRTRQAAIRLRLAARHAQSRGDAEDDPCAAHRPADAEHETEQRQRAAADEDFGGERRRVRPRPRGRARAAKSQISAACTAMRTRSRSRAARAVDGRTDPGEEIGEAEQRRPTTGRRSFPSAATRCRDRRAPMRVEATRSAKAATTSPTNASGAQAGPSPVPDEIEAVATS